MCCWGPMVTHLPKWNSETTLGSIYVTMTRFRGTRVLLSCHPGPEAIRGPGELRDGYDSLWPCGSTSTTLYVYFQASSDNCHSFTTRIVPSAHPQFLSLERGPMLRQVQRLGPMFLQVGPCSGFHEICLFTVPFDAYACASKLTCAECQALRAVFGTLMRCQQTHK